MTLAAADEFKLLFDAASDAVLACDGQERILHLNAAAERLLGWKQEEVRGHPFTELLPSRLHTVEGQSLLRYLLGPHQPPTRQPTLLPLQHRNGIEVLVEAMAGTAGEAEGERIVLSLRTIPEVPAYTAELLDQDASIYLWQYGRSSQAHASDTAERIYQTIVENAPLGIFHFDRTPVITACNDYFVRIVGSSKQQLMGLNLLTLRDKGIQGCVRATLAGKHARYEGDYASVTADKVTPVRIHFAPCHEGNAKVGGGVGIVEDITWQRRMEEERVHQAAQVDAMLRAAPIGMAFMDPQMRYGRVNDALARMNGLPAEDHPGRSLREVLGTGSVLLEQFVQQVLETDTALEKMELSSKDLGVPGPRRIWSASFYPVHGPDGRLLGVGVVVEDITDRKLAEAERTRLFREAQEAVRVRDDFLTIASHELKTPLTPLSLRLANLERRLERGEPVDASSLRHARQHLLRLATLINDLLDTSRIESGGLALHPQPTRLDVLVEHVIHVTESAHEVEHRILFPPPSHPVEVHGDPYRLEQVVANLLENALKYSPDGGTIDVALETRGDVVLLSVKDSGIGIPADQQQHLFERYFRARNVSTHSYGGLGLGLYICRDIVARHGGRIWVESEVGRGSTFYVALPTLQAARAAPSPALAPHVH